MKLLGGFSSGLVNKARNRKTSNFQNALVQVSWLVVMKNMGYITSRESNYQFADSITLKIFEAKQFMIILDNVTNF